MRSSFESRPRTPIPISAERGAQSLVDHVGVNGKLINLAEEERRHVARELHDDIGQRLSWLAVELDTLQKQLKSQKTLRERLEAAVTQVQELAADVHNMAHRLHSVKLQHLGLPAALREVCLQISRQHRVEVNLDADRACSSLSEDVSLCLYRVAQEALNNAVKHSHSKRVEVHLNCRREQVLLQVRDFGIGFDPATHMQGLGLATMHERLRMLGGTLSIQSISGGGTEVVAEAKTEGALSAMKAVS
jgi:signal transduction histidine kinase